MKKYVHFFMRYVAYANEINYNHQLENLENFTEKNKPLLGFIQLIEKVLEK